MNLFSNKTKNIFRGSTNNSEYIRKRNISCIFKTTYFRYEDIGATYDKCLCRLNNEHDRAKRMTERLLEIESNR